MCGRAPGDSTEGHASCIAIFQTTVPSVDQTLPELERIDMTPAPAPAARPPRVWEHDPLDLSVRFEPFADPPFKVPILPRRIRA